MRLVRIEAVKQAFEQEASSEMVALTFEQEGSEVVKRVKIGDCSKAVHATPLKAEAAYLIVKASREAQRDLAYMKYGEPEWRKHVEWGRFWEEELSPREVYLVQDAVELIRKQAF